MSDPQSNAKRVMTKEEALRKHRELVAQGWERRFTIEDPRLTEMKEYYESLGLEVRVETGIPDREADCQSCFEVEEFSSRYKTLYTRGETREEDDLDDMFD